MRMAGSAFQDPRVVELVSRDAVAVLIDIRDAAEAQWVREHGVQLTPHVVIADSEGEQWGFLSDVHTADQVLAEFAQAAKLMKESAEK